jgi:hypothetical protein
MKFLKHLFIGAAVLVGTAAFAQDSLKFKSDELFLEYDNVLPQDLKVKGPVQGFAIYKNYGFSLRNRGMCVVMDLKKGEYVNSFMLEGNKSHCNNAGFGKEKYSKDSQFPLLYITECMGKRCCYVTDITLEGSKIVQKIFYDSDEFRVAMDWVVDAKNNFIWVYGGKHFGTKYLKKLPLPKLSDSDENGEVHYTKEDVLQEIVIEGLAIAQGSKIRKGKAYLPDGCSREGNKLHVINLKTGEKEGVYYYADQLNEPEGLDFKGKYLYTVFHPVRKTIRYSMIYRTRL